MGRPWDRLCSILIEYRVGLLHELARYNLDTYRARTNFAFSQEGNTRRGPRAA